MLIIDYVILAVVAVSALIGLIRGFLREAISLATWIVAVWVVHVYAGDVAGYFASKVESPVVRLMIAGAILFIVVLLLGAALGYLASVLVKSTGLSGTDRLLGMVFGALRGVILLALLLVVAVALLPVTEESWWSGSQFIPYIEQAVVWLRDLLPPEVAEYLEYAPAPEPATAPGT